MAKNLDQYAERLIKKFGQRVRRLRQERGWTLEHCEERGYPGWRHLQAVETGRKVINLKTLLRIADLFETEPSELLKGLPKER